MRRAAVLLAAVLMGALLAPSSAFATEEDRRTDDGRWIAVEEDVVIVLPNGETMSGDEPAMEGEGEAFAPPVGTRVFITEALYETSDGTTRGDAAGRTYIECTAQAVSSVLLCDAVFSFEGGSQLHGSVVVDFAPATPTEQFRLDVAVTGGTGDYSGASGEVALTDISEQTEGDETVTLYEANLE